MPGRCTVDVSGLGWVWGRMTRAGFTSDPEQGVLAGVGLPQLRRHVLPHPVQRLVHRGRLPGSQEQEVALRPSQPTFASK